MGATSDPPRALSNPLARDAMFTEVLRSETVRLGLDVVEVEVGTTEAEVLEQVRAALGL